MCLHIGSGIQHSTTALVNMIHTEAIPGHNTGIIATTPEAAHNAQAPHTGFIVIDPTMIHHIHQTKDHQHIEAHHTTPSVKSLAFMSILHILEMRFT